MSKLCNVLFTKELARRYPAITSTSLHPGVIASDIWSRRIPRPFAWLMTRFMKATADRARTAIHCATAADVVSGRYYTDAKAKRPRRAIASAASRSRRFTNAAASSSGAPTRISGFTPRS